MTGKDTIAAWSVVVRDPELTGDMTRLWGLYRSYDSGRGAWPSDATLAEHMGKAVRTVKACRAELVRRGYLQSQRKRRQRAVYRAVLPPGKSPMQPQSGSNGQPPWEAFGVDGAEAAVVAIEQLARLRAADPDSDAFAELSERWGAVWEALDGASLRAAPDLRAARAELHRQLPAIVRRLAG